MEFCQSKKVGTLNRFSASVITCKIYKRVYVSKRITISQSLTSATLTLAVLGWLLEDIKFHGLGTVFF